MVVLIIAAGICFYNIFTLKYKNFVLLPFFILVMGLRLYDFRLTGDILVLMDGIAGMIAVVALLSRYTIRGKRNFGGGDIKLVGILGLHLGLVYSIVFIILSILFLWIMGWYIKNRIELQRKSTYPTGIIWLYALTGASILRWFESYVVMYVVFGLVWLYLVVRTVYQKWKSRKKTDEVVSDEDILKKYKEQMKASELEAIKISGVISKTGVLESKIGGDPYWPSDQAYPKDAFDIPMALLAQVNCRELPENEMLPEEGILQFYISCMDDVYGMNFDNPTEQLNFRVVYHEEVKVEKSIMDFGFVNQGEKNYFPIDGEARMIFEPIREQVSTEDVRFEEYFSVAAFEALSDDEYDAYYEAHSGSGHKMGGYAYFTQTDPRMKWEYDQLLLQLDSDDSIHMMWGDVGVCNFFISSEDLENRRFDQVMYNWDCS